MIEVLNRNQESTKTKTTENKTMVNKLENISLIEEKEQQKELKENKEEDDENCIIIKQTKEYYERSWEELKEIIDQDRLDVLGRKIKDQKSMELHMRKVKLEFNSVKDYIYFKVFGFPTERISSNNNNSNSDNTIIITKRPDNIEQKLVFRPNDFPYSCEKSISHWVLWCLKPLEFEEAKILISKLTNRQLGNDENGFLFFINPIHLQSIKEISHYHVFIKNIDPHQLEFSI